MYFASSDPQAVLPANTTLTSGTATVSALLETAGAQTVTVTDVNNPMLTAGFNVQVLPPRQFSHRHRARIRVHERRQHFLRHSQRLLGQHRHQLHRHPGLYQLRSRRNPARQFQLTNGSGTFPMTATLGAQTITAIDTVNTNLGATSAAIQVAFPNIVVNLTTDDAGVASNCVIQPTPAITTNTDTCALRDALALATATGTGAITFDSTVFFTAQTITLASATLAVNSSTSITGATASSGANLVTINGNSVGPVFTVGSGATAVTIANLSITGGSGSNGGGILNNGALTVANSGITGNTASSEGGGIYSSGALIVTGSTIANNSAGSQSGGGIAVSSATLTVTDSTIANNSASIGGGILASDSTVSLTNVTITGNSSTSGAGILNTSSIISLANSIVSGDTGGDTSGGFTDNGGNLVGVSGINLSALGSYGGSTQSIVPLAGSPAICAGSAAAAPALTTDQRGLPLDPNCPAGSVDSGAVQSSYAIAFTVEPASPSFLGESMRPSPRVTLTESGQPATFAASTITVADSASALSGTLTTTTVSGVAIFGNIAPTAAASSDTLQAMLSLNPALSTPLSLTALSSSFATQAGTAAALTSPAPGSTLTSASAVFVWTGGAGVLDYELLIGTTGIGSSNVYNSGVITTSSATVTVPTTGITLYVRLRQFIGGVWQSADYTYTELLPRRPHPLPHPLPAPRSSSATPTFTWTGGVSVQDYDLTIGTTGVGSANVDDSGGITVTSRTPTVPTTGATLYVRLRQRINGVWQPYDYTYTQYGLPTPAALTSPASGSTLTGASVTFRWTGGIGVLDYVLLVGTTGVASSNIYDSGDVKVTSEAVTVPTQGATLYVRLRQLLNGAWQQRDYIYTEFGSLTPATLTSPTPGSTLTAASSLTATTAASTSVTFTWTGGVGVVDYVLLVGTTGVASSKIYDSGDVNVTSETVTVPTQGATLYVRLRQLIGGAWRQTDYTYTEPGTPTPATLTSPTPGSTLTGSTVTFTWAGGIAIQDYQLIVGTTGLGSSNIYNSDPISSTITSETVTVPTTGATLYVRLRQRLNGAWQQTDYTYTEQ